MLHALWMEIFKNDLATMICTDQPQQSGNWELIGQDKITIVLFTINSKYMLFTGREGRIGKNCARGLEYLLETEGTVFPNTDRPRPVNNIFIYF